MALRFTKKHNWVLGHGGRFQRSLMETFLRRVLQGRERRRIYLWLSLPSVTSPWLKFASLGMNAWHFWHCFLAPLAAKKKWQWHPPPSEQTQARDIPSLPAASWALSSPCAPGSPVVTCTSAMTGRPRVGEERPAV